jgi:hypothetical protein
MIVRVDARENPEAVTERGVNIGTRGNAKTIYPYSHLTSGFYESHGKLNPRA